jgi:hypothetical protein
MYNSRHGRLGDELKSNYDYGMDRAHSMRARSISRESSVPSFRPHTNYYNNNRRRLHSVERDTTVNMLFKIVYKLFKTKFIIGKYKKIDCCKHKLP